MQLHFCLPRAHYVYNDFQVAVKEISLFLNIGLTTAKKSPKTSVIIIKTLQNTTKMMWKWRNCHLRETNLKFHGFLGGPYPQTSLEACTLGTSVSAFGAKKNTPNFPSKGVAISVHVSLIGHVTLKKIQIIIKDIFFVHPSRADPSSSKPFWQ